MTQRLKRGWRLAWESKVFSHHGKVGPLMTGGGFKLLVENK